jgi:hypothetical protein
MGPSRRADPVEPGGVASLSHSVLSRRSAERANPDPGTRASCALSPTSGGGTAANPRRGGPRAPRRLGPARPRGSCAREPISPLGEHGAPPSGKASIACLLSVAAFVISRGESLVPQHLRAAPPRRRVATPSRRPEGCPRRGVRDPAFGETVHRVCLDTRTTMLPPCTHMPGTEYIIRAVPCRAVPCRAVPCRAVPCRAVPCRAVHVVVSSDPLNDCPARFNFPQWQEREIFPNLRPAREPLGRRNWKSSPTKEC